jgi:hypothetical protein
VGSRRPTGLTIIAFLWILTGALNGIGAIGNLQNLFPQPPFSLSSYPSSFVVLSEFLVGSPAFLAIFSLTVAIGLAQGKRWSYRAGLALPLVALALQVVTIELATGYPTVHYVALVELPIALAWVAAVWIYFRRPYVKGWLGVTAL